MATRERFKSTSAFSRFPDLAILVRCRRHSRHAAGGVVVALATSAFSILMAPLLAIICGSVDVPMFVRSIRRPASIVSLAFLAVAAAGAFWSEAGVAAGLHALGPLIKLLVLPFLLYYFEKSARGGWVIGAFLFSCVVLLVNSWIVVFEPTLALKTGRCCGEDYGVPVRNYIDQSQEFGVCLVALFSAAPFFLEKKMWKQMMFKGRVSSSIFLS